jgi:non-heme chloroperoxidase
VLFTYPPDRQPSAGLTESKLGNAVRRERFDGDGHALFVDEPEKFNRVLEEFLQSLPDDRRGTPRG